MTPTRSASTLPAPSTLSESSTRAAWTWLLCGFSALYVDRAAPALRPMALSRAEVLRLAVELRDAGLDDAPSREALAWSILAIDVAHVLSSPVTAAQRDETSALVDALVGVAPWQRGACARSAWACASRASRRRGFWPRTLPLVGASASHRLSPAVALDLLAGLVGDCEARKLVDAATRQAAVFARGWR